MTATGFRSDSPRVGPILIAVLWGLFLALALIMIITAHRPTPEPGTPCGPDSAICFHGATR